MKRADKKELNYLLDRWGIEHFVADELIVTDHPDWEGKSEYMPPAELLPNIETTIDFADHLRDEWGGPIKVNSGYRPELYNDFIDGAKNSQHTQFRALDLYPNNGQFAKFHDLVDERLEAFLEHVDEPSGRGLYNWGVHIDFGADLSGYNKHRRWDRRQMTKTGDDDG